MKTQKIICHWVILLFSTLFIISSSACNQSALADSSPFKQFQAESDICKFTLEYPKLYSKDGRPESNADYYAVTFSMPQKARAVKNPDPNNPNDNPVKMYFNQSSIDVFVSKSKTHSAKTLIEFYIQRESERTGYSMLERSQITVSGITAEYAYFTDDWMAVRPASGEPPLNYYLCAYFDYHGFIWQIECTSDSEIYKQAKDDFEHVIQTFKILK